MRYVIVAIAFGLPAMSASAVPPLDERPLKSLNTEDQFDHAHVCLLLYTARAGSIADRSHMGNISAGADFKALADDRRLKLEGRDADGLASDEKVAEFKKDLEGLPVDVVEGMIATCDSYLPAVHDLIYEGFGYKPEYVSPWAE